MDFRKILSNTIGWKTNRKIVVIESDDWGSIRTRSKKDFDSMCNKGLDLSNSIFTRFDSLESNSELINLFDLLTKYKDSTGRHPVITPMCVVANPCFEKIKESEFSAYFFEPVSETFKKHPNRDSVIKLWEKGINERLFVPALHGREHLSVYRWMKLLQGNNEAIRIAFDHESWGVSKYNGKVIPEYLGAFHPDSASEINELKQIITSAGDLFAAICGYHPTHFIAPNKESAKALDSTFRSIGVKYMTMAKLRHYPLGDGKFKNELIWLGKYNKSNDQLYITRNCHFEQADPSRNDWVDYCLSEIRLAFQWGKPAVISSHRVNYIGSICEENASKGLFELGELISRIIKNWPDVEFMTSTELGQLIRKG